MILRRLDDQGIATSVSAPSGTRTPVRILRRVLTSVSNGWPTHPSSFHRAGRPREGISNRQNCCNDLARRSLHHRAIAHKRPFKRRSALRTRRWPSGDVTAATAPLAVGPWRWKRKRGRHCSFSNLCAHAEEHGTTDAHGCTRIAFSCFRSVPICVHLWLPSPSCCELSFETEQR